MRVLCVAEKPSISRAISQILSGGQMTTRSSANKFVKNYDFTYPQSNAFFTVTCVSGHLMTHDFYDTHRTWHSCDPLALFDAPVETKVAPDSKTIAQNLANEARTADMLMIWTDCDREGENIGAEVARVCRKARANIIVKRARFSAIIAQQIHHAAQHPVDLDMAQADAVEARTVLDLKIGAAFTRMQTLALQSRFSELEMVSYGPCQFPTLGFVVSRYNQVKSFVPETFWYIFLSLMRHTSDGNEETTFNWKRGHLFDFEVALAIYESVLENPTARVVKVTKKGTKKWKPLPLTTVELQKAGSRLLRLAPKKVLDVAEKLYQQGFVSYPRTETDQFDKQFDFMSLIGKQTVDPAWGGFATNLERGGFSTPRQGKNNDKAHPPIHPTAHAGNLAGDEKRVYEFITRRFLACCSRDAEGWQTTVDVECGGEAFSATGLVVLERNYLLVYPYDKWTGKELPEFAEGEEFVPSVCELREGQTSKPTLLTEADLVTLMDKNGIGTDATIAQHIQTIVDRDYVIERMEGSIKYLVPSTLGIGLIEGYNQIGFERSLSKPQLRRETERNMVQVCERTKTKHEMLEEAIEQYKDMFIRAKREFNKVVTSVRTYIQPGGGAGGGGGGGPRGGGGGAGRGAPGRGRGRGAPRGGRGGGGGGAGAGGRPDDDDGGDGGAPARGRAMPRGGAPASRRAAPRPPSPPSDMDEDFFDDAPPPARPPPSRSRPVPPPPPAPTPAASRPQARAPPPAPSRGGAGVQCGCGQPAVERTVMKETSNKGRRFWACGSAGACEFFEWVDGPSSAPGSGSTVPAKRSYADQPTQQFGGSILSSNGAPRVCQCELTAVQKTVSKEGPNQGRKFWSCPNSEKARCKYFEWDDEPQSGGNGGGASRGGSFNQGGSQISGECYKCHQEGHWASACPNGDTGGSSRARSFGSKAGGNATTGACFKCGQEGHYSNACPGGGSGKSSFGGGGGGAAGSCYKCGEEGHFSNACPGAGGGGSSRGRASSASRAPKRARGRGGSTRGRGSGTKRGAKKKSKFNAADEF